MLPRRANKAEEDDAKVDGKKQQLNTQLMPIKHSICGTHSHTRAVPFVGLALRVFCLDFEPVIFSFA